MKYLKHFLLIVVVFIAQIAIAPNMAIKLAFPNFIFIVCISLALNFRLRESLFWACIGGVLLDIYSPMRFGINTLALVGISTAIYYFFNKFISQPIAPIVIVTFFIASLLFDLIPFLIFSKDTKVYLFDAVYNTLLGTIVYYFLASVKNRENPYKLSLK